MGWRKSGTKWWYDYGNGSYPSSRWAQIGGKWYHFDSSGYMQTGWLSDGGKWYYLGADGAMVTGLQKVGSDSYYLSSSGVMQTGWVTIGKKKYYFESPSGKMVKNALRQIGGKWYRFDKDGALSLDLAATAGLKPLSLAIKRDGYQYTGSWKVPSQAKGSSSDRRWKSVTAVWELLSGSSVMRRTASQSMETTQATANLNNFKALEPSKTFTRRSFYPLTSVKLDGIRLKVIGVGQFVKDAEQVATYKFGLPRKPEISWDYDTANGTVEVTISTNAGADSNERYDTMYMVEVTKGDGQPVTLQAWKSSTATTITQSFETSEYTTGLADGQQAVFTAKAYARGIAGDNPSSDRAVTGSRAIAIPSATTIQSVTPTTKRPTGVITVTLAVGNDTSHIKLQRRHGEAGSWEDVDGAEDNGTAKTLYDSVGMAEPVDGEYLYYRIVATRDNFTTVGEPFRAVELYTPEGTAPSTTVGIVSLDMSDDGSGAKIVVGWTETSIGASTEVTWSTDPQAWESNQPPTSFDVKWKDASSQSQDWENTTTLYVRGLSAGETYYFKARRTYDDGTYSSYAASSNVTPENETGSVSLTAPSSVVKGQPFIVYWTYDGELPQTEWHVHPADNPNVALASGRDSMGSATIQPDRYDGDVVSLYVSVGVGGELTDSNIVNVRVLEVPTCEVSCDATCEAQPFSFSVTTDTPTCTVGYKVISSGIVIEEPDGTDVQLEGDVVMTDYVTPEWEAEGGEYVAEVTMPQARLVEGAEYRIEAFVTDVMSGLSSQPAETSFDVLWDHQAAEPDGCVALTPIEADRAVLVALTAPDGASEGDLYDLYRGSVEGFALIREGLPLDCSVLDRYASFGEQVAYRVRLRTADGDSAWVEQEYDMQVDRMRLDWAGGFGELAHSLHFADAYAKDFEARKHMDGSIGGAYGGSISRTGTYSAKSIKGYELSGMEGLGRHAGLAYCRTPDGRAFACNADVSRDTDNTSMLESWSLTLTEVSLTRDFTPSDDDVEVTDGLV